MSLKLLQHKRKLAKVGWNGCDCLNSASFQDAGHPEKLYKLGQAVRAKVVEMNSKPQRFVLSLTGRRSSDCFIIVYCFSDCLSKKKQTTINLILFVFQVSINWRKAVLLWGWWLIFSHNLASWSNFPLAAWGLLLSLTWLMATDQTPWAGTARISCSGQ